MNHPFAFVADDPRSVSGSDGRSGQASLDEQELLDAYSHAVVSVVDAVGPSVVSIGVNTDQRRGEGRGSGVVISSDGYVAPDAIDRELTIAFARDGRRMETITPREAP